MPGSAVEAHGRRPLVCIQEVQEDGVLRLLLLQDIQDLLGLLPLHLRQGHHLCQRGLVVLAWLEIYHTGLGEDSQWHQLWGPGGRFS